MRGGIGEVMGWILPRVLIANRPQARSSIGASQAMAEGEERSSINAARRRGISQEARRGRPPAFVVVVVLGSKYLRSEAIVVVGETNNRYSCNLESE